MTGCIHHGPPGSFKSFGVLERVAIPALEKGRTVVTNIRGFNDPRKIEEAMDIRLPDDAQIMYIEPDKKAGFETIARFFHWAPPGALIIIDEAQKVYNKTRFRDLSKLDLTLTDAEGDPLPSEQLQQSREADTRYQWWDGSTERPETVEEAFDMHRHYNWDIYLCTPNIAKIHPEIRQVVEVAYRHRGLGAFLKSWATSWKEFSHDPENNGKSASHYLGSPKKYKADTRVFDCYQSTKTGKAKGTSETRSLWRDPRLAMYGVLLLATLGFFANSLSKVIESDAGIAGMVGSSSKEDPKNPDQGSPDNSRNVDRVRIAKTDLAGEFNTLTPPGSAGPSNVAYVPGNVEPQPLASYMKSPADHFQAYFTDPGYLVRLGAALIMSNSGEVKYSINVYQGGSLVTRFFQDEVRSYGFQEHYSPSGLLLYKGDWSVMVRHLHAQELRRGRGGKPGAIPAPTVTVSDVKPLPGNPANKFM